MLYLDQGHDSFKYNVKMSFGLLKLVTPGITTAPDVPLHKEAAEELAILYAFRISCCCELIVTNHHHHVTTEARPNSL